MVTDTQRIMRTDPGRPEVCNVCQLQRFFGDDYEELWDGERTARTGCVDMKRAARRSDRRATTRRPASATSSCMAKPERRSTRSSPPAPSRLAPAGGRHHGRGPRRRWACDDRSHAGGLTPMGFELTPRERRWFDAILVLGALALGFIVLGFVGVIFAIFGDLIMVFFLAWLLAFMLGPVVNAVTAIPFMSRTGAIFVVYFAAVRRRSSSSRSSSRRRSSARSATSSRDLPGLRANLPTILAPWQERLERARASRRSTSGPGHDLPRQHQPVRRPAGRAAPADRRREPRRDRQPAARRRAVAVHGRGPRAARWRSASGSSRPATGPRRRSSRRRSAGRSAGSSAARSSPASCSGRSASSASLVFGLDFIAVTTVHRRRAHGDPVLRAVRGLDPAGPRGDPDQARRALPASGSWSASAGSWS